MKRILQALTFYPLAAVLYLLSLFPLRLLYVLSDGLYLFLCYILGYRKKVVRKNLENSFPSYPPEEITRLEKKYYRHLSDLVVENIWALTATKKQMRKRCAFTNYEVFDRLYDQGKDVIGLMGHLGNWEWCGLSMSCFGRYRLRALYRPLKDPFFNRLFLRFRSHLGGEMIPMQQVARHMLTKSPAPVCTAFIADQTPPPETAFWTNFLHQDTPFFTGYATLGNKTGLPVIMVTLRKIRRGYYTATIDLLTENAAEIAPADLVALYAQKLEASIEEQPAYWLWSHKRWKHKRVVKDEF